MADRDTITEAAKELANNVRLADKWAADWNRMRDLCDTILADEEPELEPGVYECARVITPAWLIVTADDEDGTPQYVTVDKDDGYTVSFKNMHCEEVTDITPYPKPASRELMERAAAELRVWMSHTTSRNAIDRITSLLAELRSHCDPVRVTANQSRITRSSS